MRFRWRLSHNSAHQPEIEIRVDPFNGGFRVALYGLFAGAGLYGEQLIEEKVISSEDAIAVWEQAHVRGHMNAGAHETALKERALAEAQWGGHRRVFA